MRLSAVDKGKIREFVSEVDWQEPDWDDAGEIDNLLGILKAFNNNPQTAVKYWKAADEKSYQAMQQFYLDQVHQLGLSTEKPISNHELLNCFGGDQQAVDRFFAQLKEKGDQLANKVFYQNFTQVVQALLAEKTTIQ